MAMSTDPWIDHFSPNETDVNEELKKLGLRLRTRKVERAVDPLTQQQDRPGQIAFDERGNAVYEWKDHRLTEDGENGERARRRALAHPSLSLVDEEPRPNVPIQNNVKGLRVGYNPYESGLLKKNQWNKKRDLRELSKWLEMKRKVSDSDKG